MFLFSIVDISVVLNMIIYINNNKGMEHPNPDNIAVSLFKYCKGNMLSNLTSRYINHRGFFKLKALRAKTVIVALQ